MQQIDDDPLFRQAASVLHDKTERDPLRGYWLTVFIKDTEKSEACTLHTNYVATPAMVDALLREILKNPQYNAVAQQAIKDRIDSLFAEQAIGRPQGSA